MNPTRKNSGFMWINFGSKTPPNSQLLKDFWGFLLRHPILIKWVLLWDCCKGMVWPKVSVLNISCFFFTTYRGFSKAARMEKMESFQNMNRILGRKVIHHKDAHISLVLHMFQRTISPENTKKNTHHHPPTPKNHQKQNAPNGPMAPSTVRQFHPWLVLDAAVPFLAAGSVVGGVHSTARQPPTVQTTKRLPINRATARLHPA